MANRLARVLIVALLGCGVGCLTWGVSALVFAEQVRPSGCFRGMSLVCTATEALGWGAGTLTAGVTALVLLFVGRNPVR